jgi:hypothetical protein
MLTRRHRNCGTHIGTASTTTRKRIRVQNSNSREAVWVWRRSTWCRLWSPAFHVRCARREAQRSRGGTRAPREAGRELAHEARQGELPSTGGGARPGGARGRGSSIRKPARGHGEGVEVAATPPLGAGKRPRHDGPAAAG